MKVTWSFALVINYNMVAAQKRYVSQPWRRSGGSTRQVRTRIDRDLGNLGFPWRQYVGPTRRVETRINIDVIDPGNRFSLVPGCSRSTTSADSVSVSHTSTTSVSIKSLQYRATGVDHMSRQSTATSMRSHTSQRRAQLADGGMNSPVVNIGSLTTGGIPVSMTGSQRREVREEGQYETVWPSFGSLQLARDVGRGAVGEDMGRRRGGDNGKYHNTISRFDVVLRFTALATDIIVQDLVELSDQEEQDPAEDQTTRPSALIPLTMFQLDDELVRAVKLTSRERRFIKFASVEYDGQLYMTPQDFLESVVEQEPRPRLKRRVLTSKELEMIRDQTPPLSQSSPQMFRTLRDKGIISYTEYLFLLSILTKPRTGFEIAFNMFDTDGNQRVDKNEFLVIRQLLGGNLLQDREIDEKTQIAMEKIFSHAWRGKHGIPDTGITEDKTPVEAATPYEEYVDDSQGLQRRHLVDTTLIVHFFGKKGKDELQYEGFRKFMENLQTEVLELEFHEFSKGQDTISEVDFAKILLRYTYLDTNEYDMYLDRLLDRIKEEKGITFNEFQVFCQFLNNLEDFTIAMRMYTLADHPISKGIKKVIFRESIPIFVWETVLDKSPPVHPIDLPIISNSQL
uniref:EF-hand domain-containing protein n=1 Tax=Timema douglasi TaxID=61478 RepID=A0A7R8VEK2_TIMDO|nr:unnamed protein product [Timema douglasi]